VDSAADFRAEVLKDILRPEKLDHSPASSQVRVPTTVDLIRLPETPYKRLVGRSRYLTTLTHAWKDQSSRIVALIAWGGSGKSALVNDWLARLGMAAYLSAEVVLGWSFYNQGTKKRDSSADPFMSWAIEQLGLDDSVSSATAKADALAAALARKRVLLVMDGMEPLQDGPGPNIGSIKDLGLRTFLRRHAANPAGPIGSLIVVTTRVPISDLDQWNGRSVSQISLERLEPAAGEELLRDNGVVGTSKSLRQVVRDFHGHPLALQLLAGFLTELHGGNVSRRDRVRSLLRDSDAIGHDQAHRVMEAYKSEWLDRQPRLLAVLHLVGLFDRPAGRDCLEALRLEPAIDGLTDTWTRLDETSWNRAIDRLRKVGLLAPDDDTAPGSLDTHPLVREWFANDLQSSNPLSYARAHARLYEHLQSTTLAVANPSLEQLAPLYQAISHGAQADCIKELLTRCTRIGSVGETQMAFYRTTRSSN
jgi:hypothetical protein